MRERVEMQLGEWFVRLFSKLIALGAAIFGAAGFVIFGMRTILPLLDDGRYVETACAGIACVAVLYGLTPLALAVDGSLLNAFGMEPLKGHRQDSNQER
ncbi:hypothetical protein [Ralstonia solanacearum]|uniref:hypothetical protein n=1 Tax=Ralstonia solanacearum TaxID=305 RepID=UPI0005ACD256|nr:hypothetical protein [Ralstonia solanacearum]MDC6177135.1 hypothetical protein [Ralstonia solanacearum]MDC6238333.1 hypothetical protein [Ralstonia solanacearum]